MSTTTTPPTASPIAGLIQQHLLQERGFLDGSGCDWVSNWPWMDVGEAIARAGVAPEHAIGERTLALFTLEEDYPDSFNCYLLFTDRRIVGRWPRLNGTSVEVNLRYAWIGGAVIEGGMLSQKLKVQHGDQVVEIMAGGYHEKLKAFIDALVAVPPEQREPAPSPLCVPTEADPSGARAARAALLVEDHRAAFLLDYIARAHEGGLMSAQIAADLVGRIALQHRNEHQGRGVADGSWMSPLGRDDLSNVLIALYKNPIRHVEEPYRALTFDARNKVDKLLGALDAADAVLSLDIGAAFAPKATNHFTVLMNDVGSYCAFRLLDNQVPLRERAPELVEEVHALLDRLEAATLLRRCAYGWNGSATELLQVPSSDLTARLAQVVGEFDARVLGRPQDQGRQRKR